jgi:hypothetical protein
MTPEDLVEIELIRQLKARYFHFMDQKRWDEWEQVFCEDVVIDTTQDGPDVLQGRAVFRAYLLPILEGVKTVHHGHCSQIELTSPTTAEATWSMEDHLWWPPEKGGNYMWGTGFYLEQYRKEADGQWRIAELKLRRTRVEVNGVQTFPPEDA